MIRKKIPQKACERCGRGATTGYNRPHSLHRTKRLVLINLQRKNGKLLCTRCLRTIKKIALKTALKTKIPA